MWRYTSYIGWPRQPLEAQSRSLLSIVDRIRPSLISLDIDQDPGTLLQQAVRANIHSSVHQLQHESKILKNLVKKGNLFVLGAEYSLDTGIVNFFDELP